MEDGPKLVPRGERQQGDVPGLLDGAGQAALVRGANAGEPPWHDLAALGHKSLQQADIAVGIASIFSVQNLQTFLRRKNFPRPPGHPRDGHRTAGSTAAGARTGTGARS